MAELIDFAYQAVEEVAVVAHDNQRTVEVHQRLLQDVFGLQVEVVGRFVQDKEVHRLEQQPDHGQTGTLAAGEHLDLLHRGFGTAEQGGLVLGEVTYLYVVAQRQGTFVLNFAHDTFYQCGLSLTVAAHEGHLVAAFDGERRVLEYHVVAVRLAHTVHDDGIVA